MHYLSDILSLSFFMAFYTDQDPFVFLKVIKLRLDISHDSSSSLISVKIKAVNTNQQSV